MNRLLQFLRNNGFSLIIGIALIVLMVSPDAKSFVLRQMMLTGFFNASIDRNTSEDSNDSHVDFSFEDGNGTIQNTASLRNKVVFVNFWASWCPPCRAEFPSIEKLYSEFKDHPDVFFLMINEDSDPTTAKAYLNKEKYSVPYTGRSEVCPRKFIPDHCPPQLCSTREAKSGFIIQDLLITHPLVF